VRKPRAGRKYQIKEERILITTSFIEMTPKSIFIFIFHMVTEQLFLAGRIHISYGDGAALPGWPNPYSDGAALPDGRNFFFGGAWGFGLN
jgi:hypothetical protein